jgi:hypothetical protein
LTTKSEAGIVRRAVSAINYSSRPVGGASNYATRPASSYTLRHSADYHTIGFGTDRLQVDSNVPGKRKSLQELQRIWSSNKKMVPIEDRNLCSEVFKGSSLNNAVEK